MAAKFFGQFLLEAGLIDKDQLLEALQVQRDSNPMLGELAQARGWLTAAQAARINERQRAEDKRFGDIAGEMGLLTAGQVDQLLDEQKSRRKLFGEILVERGMLDRDQLDAALRAHQADRDDALRSLEHGLAGHRVADIAHVAIQTCARLFPRLLKAQCQFSRLLDDATALPDCAVTAHVRIDAARPFAIGLACDARTATAAACGFLGVGGDECDDALALDALGELVNVVMGYVVKDVVPEDAAYTATPPDFGRAIAGFMAERGRTLALELTSQLGPMVLVING